MKRIEGDFDYIVVGAGTAGCIVANRLSTNPKTRVLILEAGGNDNWIWFHIPVGFLFAIGNPRLQDRRQVRCRLLPRQPEARAALVVSARFLETRAPPPQSAPGKTGSGRPSHRREWARRRRAISPGWRDPRGPREGRSHPV